MPPIQLTQGQTLYDPKTGKSIGTVQFDTKTGQRLNVGQTTQYNLPAPSVPTSPTQITQGINTPQIPTPSPYYGNVSDAQATATGTSKMLELLIKQQEDYQAQIKEQQVQQQQQTQGFLQKILGSKTPGQVRDETFAQTGINPTEYFAEERAKIEEINTLSQDYNKIVADRDSQIATTMGQTASVDYLNNAVAQIERNAAPRLNQLSSNINAKAATLQALQGRFNEAQNFVNQAVQDATADLKYNVDMFQMFYQVNQDSIQRLDTKYQNAFNQAFTLANQEYNRQYEEKQLIGQLMVENPQAGVTMADTLSTAYQKISKNPYNVDYLLKLKSLNKGSDTEEQNLFTKSQLNTGAARASLGLDIFENLAYETKNFFINNKSSADGFNQIKSEYLSGEIDYESAVSEIMDSTSIDEVTKQDLIQIVNNLPRQEKKQTFWQRLVGKKK